MSSSNFSDPPYELAALTGRVVDSFECLLKTLSKGGRINLNFANVGAGDGNRTHVRSLGSFYTAIVRRPLWLLSMKRFFHLRNPSPNYNSVAVLDAILRECRSNLLKRNLAGVPSCHRSGTVTHVLPDDGRIYS